MKKTRSWWLVSRVAILVLGMTACERAAHDSGRVQRIENGLLTAVVIRGQPSKMKLTERMAYYGVPGVSIAIINNGQIEWAKGYGVLEARGTKAVTALTRFQAASISKPLTAMAVLSLVQAGKLTLDENVNLELKSWPVPDNEFTKDQNVTLRRLLNHSAGVTVEDVGSYAADEQLPTLIQALDGVSAAHSPPIRVDMVPGTKWRYSGGGYSVVQQVLIDVTGKPFAALMHDLVLRKIGMTHSTFDQPLPRDWEASAATGHDVNGEPLQGRWHIFPQAAAAGLWTTPTDLAQFAIALQQSYKATSNRVLSVDMTHQTLTKQLGGYGLGLWLGGKDAVTNFSHAGQNEGFTCILMAYLDTGQGAVVMMNGDRGSGLFNEILRAVAREYGWPDYQPTEKTVADVNPAVYQSYVGEYDANGIPTTISIHGQQLFVVAPPLGPRRVRLYPSAGDRFFLLDQDVDLSFVRDQEGRVTEMQATTNVQTVTAKKVKQLR
jgi:CubicO group peptidase (beta-lactamase class C family)